MRRTLTITILSMLLCMVAIDAGAQMHDRGRGPRHGHGPGGPGPGGEGGCFGDPAFLRDALKLDEGQIEAVGRINREHRDELRALKERLRPLQRDLRALLLGDPVDMEKVRAMLRSVADVEIELRLARIKHRLAIEKVFTPEQREKHRREMKKRMRADD
ncbi:MAG TPA: Spy/CpxP family protein refolding chaperone [Spirochaetota bacterium]|nr:Spy/CpxP family protein refolding chaperone [Spirochaetota bacterium]HNT12875.1 Spy/CpxP family protein refolding chaperone [Spirochaetota bacterium]HNV47151.1 Spy/CpxP family protein refolding chaperone [Spirochaetota bacterium]HOS41499.1 Spy/CpxP family protein refolding chaperone [Spirochaetota bacterium]HPI22105.1 Spy/CpxP family protein refolding chaperone [Spirochaetota bacterium]